MNKEKEHMLKRGEVVAEQFCKLNNITMPGVRSYESYKWPYDKCAFYRKDWVNICPTRCAHLGRGGRSWSWPGYVVDRTPYGVIQHEVGHHVDLSIGSNKGAYWSEFSSDLRKASGEKPITSYCPNDAEWFAEIFRLFITNPDLLRCMRPKTYDLLLIEHGFIPLFQDTWRQRLENAPERTLNAAQNKVK